MNWESREWSEPPLRPIENDWRFARSDGVELFSGFGLSMVVAGIEQVLDDGIFVEMMLE